MSEAIRVLQVVTHMNRGGLETMLMNYYRYIDRDKVQFDFLVHREYRADYDDEIESLGGRIYRLPQLIPWSRDYRKSLDTFFKAHKEYKIIHVHQDCLSSVILKAAKENGIPVRIAHSHAASQDKNLKYLIKLYYKRFIPKYATELFSCGKEAGDWMFGGADYTILNNAIAAKQYVYNREIRERIRCELCIDDCFVVGLVGRFSPQKNHFFLLEIFKALVEMDSSARLLLVGDGELRAGLEKKIQELGIADKVILTGVRTDVADLLQAFDAFVMPSNYEGLSLAIVEAQAAGLPCFISDKVPIECKKTDFVEQISLAETSEYWARRIITSKNVNRKDTYETIKKAGFDVEENARWLQDYYILRQDEV